MVLLHAGEYKAWNTLGMGDNSYHHQEIINDMMLTNEALHFRVRESQGCCRGVLGVPKWGLEGPSESS